MKKLFMMMAILSVVLFADKLTTKEWANVRVAPNPSAQQKGTVPPGTYEILDVFADYVEAVVLSNSGLVGRTGYVWEGAITKGADKYIPEIVTIGGQGCVFNPSPAKSTAETRIGILKAGTIIKVTRIKATWVLIPVGETKLWVCLNASSKIIK